MIPHLIINVHLILGLASRLCDGDPAVWHGPNVENCSTVEITRITEEINNLISIINATQNPNNSDRTIMVEPDILQSISGELANVTNKNDTAILPNDLEDTIYVTGAIIRLNYTLSEFYK